MPIPIPPNIDPTDLAEAAAAEQRRFRSWLNYPHAAQYQPMLALPPAGGSSATVGMAGAFGDALPVPHAYQLTNVRPLPGAIAELPSRALVPTTPRIGIGAGGGGIGVGGGGIGAGGGGQAALTRGPLALGAGQTLPPPPAGFAGRATAPIPGSPFTPRAGTGGFGYPTTSSARMASAFGDDVYTVAGNLTGFQQQALGDTGRAAASVADDAAAATARAGGIRGGLARIGGARLPASMRTASGATLSRALLPVGIGMAGGSLIDSLNLGGEDSDWDRGLSEAAKWGGFGAGLGSMILPGWGTAVGGGLFALGGGIYGAFKGEDPKKRLAKAMSEAEQTVNKVVGGQWVDPELKQYASLMLQSAIAAPMVTEKDGTRRLANGPVEQAKAIKQAASSIAASIPELQMQLLDERARQREQLEMQMATQEFIGRVMGPQLQQLQRQAEIEAASYREMAKQVTSPAQKQAYELQAEGALSDAARLATAYQHQAQFLPYTMAVQQQQQQQQALANQITQQVQAQVMAQMLGAGSAGNSIDELMAAAAQ